VIGRQLGATGAAVPQKENPTAEALMDDRTTTQGATQRDPYTSQTSGLSNDSTPRNEPGTPSEIARCVKVLLGAYRLADASDPEIYETHLRRVLGDYPLWVAQQAAVRCADELKWLPAPAEVRDVCDAIYGPVVRRAEREQRISRQLADRGLPRPAGQKQTYEEFCQEMKARGMPLRRQDHPRQDFNVEEFKAKEGITKEMWDQIPEGNCKLKKLG
jgi:hypothetical protein